LVFSTLDGYPVTKGHTLVIPKRHFLDYFDSTKEEREAIFELLEKQKYKLLKEDPTIQGFNVGINIGEMAGQSIFHLHVHLFPRRKGDIENPRGGVRGIIPSKRNYSK